MSIAEAPAPTQPEARELDSRESDGIAVRLTWRPGSDRVQIHVQDRKHDEGFVFSVPNAQAQDAFLHPYAYRP